MSTPSNPKAAARPKPKRPLSGYNLFYRYKRNKILEATARPSQDNEAVIRAVLEAPVGLEGVSPTSPLFRLCGMSVDEFRVKNIRAAMEGKLFPNENARNRLHRKLHGMGFVEMGKMMRLMWGQADKIAKELFNELADVGRVRYRRLVAEYKRSSDRPEEPVKSSMVEKVAQTQTSIKTADAETAAKKEAMAALPATNAKTEPMAKRAKPSLIPQQAPSSSDPMLKARSVWAAKNSPPAATAAVQSADPKPGRIHRPAYSRQVSSDVDFRGPIPLCGSCGPMEPAAHKPSYVRKVSREIDLRDGSLSDLSTETNAAPCDEPGTPKTRNGRKLGRQASTDVRSLMGEAVNPPFPALPMMGDNAASSGSNLNAGGPRTNVEMQQILLRNAIAKIKGEIAQNNMLLPPEMRVHPQGHFPGERAYHGAMAPTSSGAAGANTNGSNGPNKKDSSIQDFMQFIGTLDEAIDVDRAQTNSNVHSIDDSCHRPAFEKPGQPPQQISIPGPAAIELKTNLARVA